jgi:hypothetical protein
MKTAKAILFICMGVVLGMAGHMAWQSLLTPPATVSGMLRYEPETDPAVSASHPAGFYVESRVYLKTASQDDVGHTVRSSGLLGLTKDPDAASYPKIENGKLTILKSDGVKATATIPASSKTSPQALIEVIKRRPDTVKDVYLTTTDTVVNLKDGSSLQTDSIEQQGDIAQTAKEAKIACYWE